MTFTLRLALAGGVAAACALTGIAKRDVTLTPRHQPTSCDWRTASLQAPTTRPVPENAAVDFSGYDAFASIARDLSQDRAPSDSAWDALFAMRAYRSLGPRWRRLRELIPIALRPSLASARDSLLRVAGPDAVLVSHIARSGAALDALDRFRDSLSTKPLLPEAIRRASVLLPPFTTQLSGTPTVMFAIFGPDGYGVTGGIVIDLMFASEQQDPTSLVGHELHHAFASTLSRVRISADDRSPEAAILRMISSLRSEGVADMIDKYEGLRLRSPWLSAYVDSITRASDSTPSVLRAVDSLVRDLATAPDHAEADSRRIAALLPFNGHPAGAYMARKICAIFGVDSLMSGLSYPTAFLRAFTAAELAVRAPPSFSKEALQFLVNAESRRARH